MFNAIVRSEWKIKVDIFLSSEKVEVQVRSGNRNIVSVGFMLSVGTLLSILLSDRKQM